MFVSFYPFHEGCVPTLGLFFSKILVLFAVLLIEVGIKGLGSMEQAMFQFWL